MRRFILTLILILGVCAAFFYALSWPRGMGTERAVGGVLDLTGVDFTQTRYNLEGEWEFFFGALYTPKDFASGTAYGGTHIHVPGSWHEAGYPRHGFATYRLIIRADEPSLMLFLPQITSASVVWINGERVLEAGTVTTEPIEEHGARNAFIPFSPQNGETEIIVQAANFTWFTGGLRSNLVLGTPEQVLEDAFFRRVVLSLLIGMFLVMFFYHLLLFAHNRNEWVYLAFAGVCILSAAQFILETDGLLHLFWGRTSATRNLLQIVIIFKAVALVTVTHLALKMPVGKVRGWVYAFSFCIPLLVIIFVPQGVVDARIVFLGLLPMIVLFFSALRSQRLRGNYYNYLLMAAIGAFCMVQPINRIFLDERTYYMFLVTPNLFLVLSQFFMLSESYTKARESEQRLAAENAALEIMSRMKTEYLANLSHETRTPLTVISGHVQLAADLHKNDGEDGEIISNSLRRAQNEVMRLARLAENALWLASIQDRQDNRKEALDVHELFTNTAEAYRNFIEKQGNALQLEIPKNLPHIFGNADSLIQVMANLFTNANAHTKGGEITVSAEALEKYVRITVSDNGGGIAPALLPRLFERGVTASGSAGVGLAICKQIIDAHGGEITVKSEQNRGTAVSFTVPIYEEGMEHSA